MALEEVLLEDKAIFMVFEYAEHDFLVSFEKKKERYGQLPTLYYK